MTCRGGIVSSPTGELYLGGVCKALCALLAGWALLGTIVRRIQDIDMVRVRAQSGQGLEEDLFWLGFERDEEPIEGAVRIDTRVDG